MENSLTTYKIWAPDDALWTEWAKPVLFANVPRPVFFANAPQGDSNALDIPGINWTSAADRDTAVIVDLPSREGVMEGLGLARLGYRPVPLYNGVYDQYSHSTVIDVRDIIMALFNGTDVLTALDIRSDAPPAFLLDSNRMNGIGKQPGKYDNRWCVFPQDMPSASFLSTHGIKRIIVRSSGIQNDLSHILCRYQEQGIKVYLYDVINPLREMTVTKPSQFKSLIYRFKVISGLTRNAAGGFGGQIPEPSESNSGYYRMG